MMRKAFLAMGSLLLMVSGLAAVSAYESHLVNVQGHVENALGVPTHIDFGTVFPQEFLVERMVFGLSTSFCQQGRADQVDFDFYYEGKTGFLWLGDAIYLKLVTGIAIKPTDVSTMFRMDNRGIGTDTTPPATPVLIPQISPNSIAKPLIRKTLFIGLDVPVFEGYYNPETDVNPKPSGLSAPTVIIDGPDGGVQDPRWAPGTSVTGVDLGMDLKLQVIKIHNPGGGEVCPG